MTMIRMARSAWRTAVLALGIAGAACGGGEAAQGGFETTAVGITDRQAEWEEFELCKIGPASTFDYTVRDLNTGTLTPGSITLNDGECAVLAIADRLGAEVTVTENVGSGIQLDRVVVTVLDSSGATTSRVEPGPTVTEEVSGSAGQHGLRGALAEYYNAPRGGGAGCTPGYWKNHTGLKKQSNAWAATGYAIGDSFDAVFGVTSSFGGTLLEAVSRGGAGEAALGRHAVAALLDAAHSGVSYAFSTGEVINLVRSAYASGDFESAKNQLAEQNEQGCPL